MKQIISFSGGKDSLATWIKMAKSIKPENLLVVFCDTQWEHPMTYSYIQEIIEHFGAQNQFRILKNGQSLGFESLVRKKGRFPSATARFCTSSLKVEPMIDFLLDEVNEHSIIYQGIRHEESASRAKMNAQCTYFKHYFQPYDRNDWKLERLLNYPSPTLHQKKKIETLKAKIEKGKLDPKYYTYRKKEVIEYCQKYNTDLDRPVIELTAKEVIEIILNEGLKPNPLYYFGSGRVGCYPCIYVTHSELWQIIINDFWVIEKISELEIDCGTTFFAPNYIPKRYHTGSSINKKGETASFCWITDVVKYLKDKYSQGDLLQEMDAKDQQQRGCMSAFAVCER
jgi:3'-phosphoadenosine 5'-phosphosulfate sulfotransferase (PAPS reductase)/FAD synthetase